jgi:hypothetical protein
MMMMIISEIITNIHEEMRNYRNYTTIPESTNIEAQTNCFANWIPE